VVKVLVSSCLLGERVRYHGGDALCRSEILDRWQAEGRIVGICPEVAAGLPVPRAAAEITGGDGTAVLRGDAFVGDGTGADVTAAMVEGGRSAVETAGSEGVRLAVLKDGSPSCGATYVFDGSFRGQRCPGQGVTAAMLSRAGVRLFSERQLEEAAAYLETLEQAPGPGD
jgi:uncharacterized protein YbbK (DUF523 family)